MNKPARAVFRRESDGKQFTVTSDGHWKCIEADDGERDTIKWSGGGYVSANRGHAYKHLADCECCDNKGRTEQP